MKKVISFLICICMIFEIYPANAEVNEVQIKYLQVAVNGKTKTYECLWDSEEIFCSVKDLGEITNYDFAQTEGDLEFLFYREHGNDNGEYGIELQTSVLIEVNDKKTTAEIDAMGKNYSVNCHVKDEDVFLPFEKLLYLLHAEWTIEEQLVYVRPMPLTILDFMAIRSKELEQVKSRTEDVLIDTGWLFSDSIWGQAVYATIAEIFNDFDGKIFMVWWPEEGHVKTAELYEKAILQLAKEDEEFTGKKIQVDAIEYSMNSIMAVNNEFVNKIQNIASVPANIDNIVQSIPDAVSVLEDLSKKFPETKSYQKIKRVSEMIDKGEIDTSFLEIPELNNITGELEGIGDGLAILQCVWDAYNVADRVNDWDEEYLDQIDVLANYKNPGYINENVVEYVQSSAQRLLDSYQHPLQAAKKEALQNTLGLLFSKIYDESPFGKAFSIMNGVGNCYGILDVKTAEVYDVYTELSLVTFSIKIEQLVQELFRYDNLLTTTDKLTKERIEETRNQLMIYLRLNLRNKAQLYNLNVKGNKDENWSSSAEAHNLYNEMVVVYTMLAELTETKDFDSRIILADDLDEIPTIPEDVLTEEVKNNEVLYAEILDMFYHNIQSGWAEYQEMPSAYSDEFCYLFPSYYSDPSYINKIGYCFMDLNGDGTDELLIGMDEEDSTGDVFQNVIYDLYTYTNGEILHLATSGERFTYQLCEDQTIHYWGTSGAASTAYYHYQLSTDASVLSVLESVYSEPDENWENVYWYHFFSEFYNLETDVTEESRRITEDEASTILSTWPQRTDFPLTYFSEYRPVNKEENQPDEKREKENQIYGSWLQKNSDDPILLTLNDDGELQYYSSVSCENVYDSTYEWKNGLCLDLLNLTDGNVTPVLYQVKIYEEQNPIQMTLTLETAMESQDTALLAGMDKYLEGTYERISFTKEQLEEMKISLGVPEDMEVVIIQNSPYYWDAAQRWLVQVDVYDENNQYIAGAAFDAKTMEICRNIYMYSGS